MTELSVAACGIVGAGRLCFLARAHVILRGRSIGSAMTTATQRTAVAVDT